MKMIWCHIQGINDPHYILIGTAEQVTGAGAITAPKSRDIFEAPVEHFRYPAFFLSSIFCIKYFYNLGERQ
jgi:hypothetical protein